MCISLGQSTWSVSTYRLRVFWGYVLTTWYHSRLPQTVYLGIYIAVSRCITGGCRIMHSRRVTFFSEPTLYPPLRSTHPSASTPPIPLPPLPPPSPLLTHTPSHGAWHTIFNHCIRFYSHFLFKNNNTDAKCCKTWPKTANFFRTSCWFQNREFCHLERQNQI